MKQAKVLIEAQTKEISGLKTENLALKQELKTCEEASEEMITSIQMCKDLATQVESRLGDWASGDSINYRLAVFPADFGYGSWEAKTSDSSWSETYHVYSHLPGFPDGSLHADRLIFPDWLCWNSDPPAPGYGGFMTWMHGGPRSGFPFGNVCSLGWGRIFTRFMDRIYQADNLIKDLKALLPKVLDVPTVNVFPLDRHNVLCGSGGGR